MLEACCRRLVLFGDVNTQTRKRGKREKNSKKEEETKHNEWLVDLEKNASLVSRCASRRSRAGQASRQETHGYYYSSSSNGTRTTLQGGRGEETKSIINRCCSSFVEASFVDLDLDLFRKRKRKKRRPQAPEARQRGPPRLPRPPDLQAALHPKRDDRGGRLRRLLLQPPWR